MVEPLFTYDHIQGMRPHIQNTVDKLLDTIIAEGGSKPFDLVEKFALPVPSYVCLPPPSQEVTTNQTPRSFMVSSVYLSKICLT